MEYHQKDRIMIGSLSTSKRELFDIAKAWIIVSLAFTFIATYSTFNDFLMLLVISLFTVGLGFLLHELAHKVVAQHYGCFAEFYSWDVMLFMALIFSYFFKFVFAAPGAVMIAGPVGKTRNGHISLAGPLTNVILAVIFLLNFLFVPVPFLKTLFGWGFMINTWIAMFNLIPVWNFDGKKILAWNKIVYFLMVAICVSFFVASFYLKVNFL